MYHIPVLFLTTLNSYRFKALLSTHFNFHVDDVFCALAFLVLKIIISEALWYHTSLDSHSWPYQGPYLHWQLLKL